MYRIIKVQQNFVGFISRRVYIQKAVESHIGEKSDLERHVQQPWMPVVAGSYETCQQYLQEMTK